MRQVGAFEMMPVVGRHEEHGRRAAGCGCRARAPRTCLTIGEPSGRCPARSPRSTACPCSSTTRPRSPGSAVCRRRDTCPASTRRPAAAASRRSTPNRAESAPASMPHLRHLPGSSSMTSSSPGIGQTYESGGSSMSPRGRRRLRRAAPRPSAAASASASRNAAGLMGINRYVIHPRMRPKRQG